MDKISLDILIFKGTLQFPKQYGGISRTDDSSLLPSQAEHQVPFQQKKLSGCVSKLLNMV
ncbi:hypothetical protein ABKV19_021455 [Rosa sericea]